MYWPTLRNYIYVQGYIKKLYSCTGLHQKNIFMYRIHQETILMYRPTLRNYISMYRPTSRNYIYVQEYIKIFFMYRHDIKKPYVCTEYFKKPYFCTGLHKEVSMHKCTSRTISMYRCT